MELRYISYYIFKVEKIIFALLHAKNEDFMNKKILVTGASGFIGSFLIEGGLARGMEVWAGIRKSSSRAYLKDERIRFAELDFTDSERLSQQLQRHKEEHGGWDCIIHCAGVTKCRDKADFEIGNYWATRHFIETLKRLEICPSQFIFISSLSIYGPIREKDYTPIQEHDTPLPNTAYGVSKLHAEEYMKSLSGFPYVIFRPTGVYGPREKDYFLMAKSIRNHIDFAAGFRRQDITFVYVKDLVQAVYLAVEKQATRRAYFVSDGKVYSSRTFSDLIRKELGNPWWIRITCPLWMLRILSGGIGTVSGWLRRTSTLNSDKYQIMKQRNWQCDISPLVKELGYHPEYPLERGVKEIIAWYKKEGWL